MISASEEWGGSQLSSRRILSPLAISTAGSPGRFGRTFSGFATGHATHGVDDFADGVALAGADIKSAAGYAPDLLKGAKMCLGNIQDVHVIADAGAVRRRIVVAKNFDVRCSALDGLQEAGNQMGFDAASFSALRRGAGDIEIAKRNVVESGVFAVVGEDIFKGEFGFAVRIHGRLGMILGDGEDGRLTVNSTGRGENEIVDAVAKYGVEKEYAAGYVGDVEGAGILHGFFDEGLAGKMHNGVDAMTAEDFIERGGIAEVGFAEQRLRRDRAAVTFGQVVGDDDANALADE